MLGRMTTLNEREQAERKKAERWALWAPRAALALLIAGVAAAVLTSLLAKDWPAAGQVGDFFGGHLSGFGNLAAFLLMFATLTLQRLELADARRDAQEQAKTEARRHAEQHGALVKAYQAAEQQATALLEAQKIQAETLKATQELVAAQQATAAAQQSTAAAQQSLVTAQQEASAAQVAASAAMARDARTREREAERSRLTCLRDEAKALLQGWVDVRERYEHEVQTVGGQNYALQNHLHQAISPTERTERLLQFTEEFVTAQAAEDSPRPPVNGFNRMAVPHQERDLVQLRRELRKFEDEAKRLSEEGARMRRGARP